MSLIDVSREPTRPSRVRGALYGALAMGIVGALLAGPVLSPRGLAVFAALFLLLGGLAGAVFPNFGRRRWRTITHGGCK